MPKEIAIYEENRSCHNHKNTKRDKQHFRFLYIKTFFSDYCLHLTTKEITQMHRETKKVTRDSLVWSEVTEREKKRKESDLSRRYKGDKYGSLLQIH